MSDFHDLEARGIPESLWPDDAFQQKYTKDYMMKLAGTPSPLTTDDPTAQTKSGQTQKGAKVKVRLEFEQKFILDHVRHREIYDKLVSVAKGSRIRQFYLDGDRFRHTDHSWGSTDLSAASTYVKERKKTIFVDTPYALNSEEEDTVTADEFEHGWRKSPKRLQKTRFEVPSIHLEHRTVVDFFHTALFPKRGQYIYAIVAEDEAVLESNTEHLHLRFGIPIYLEPYLLRAVDNRDPEMKIFRSANMTDNVSDIEQIEKAIKQLHDPL